jgi:hypothetical protein
MRLLLEPAAAGRSTLAGAGLAAAHAALEAADAALDALTAAKGPSRDKSGEAG